MSLVDMRGTAITGAYFPPNTPRVLPPSLTRTSGIVMQGQQADRSAPAAEQSSACDGQASSSGISCGKRVVQSYGALPEDSTQTLTGGVFTPAPGVQSASQQQHRSSGDVRQEQTTSFVQPRAGPRVSTTRRRRVLSEAAQKRPITRPHKPPTRKAPHRRPHPRPHGRPVRKPAKRKPIAKPTRRKPAARPHPRPVHAPVRRPTRKPTRRPTAQRRHPPPPRRRPVRQPTRKPVVRRPSPRRPPPRPPPPPRRPPPRPPRPPPRPPPPPPPAQPPPPPTPIQVAVFTRLCLNITL